MIFFLNMHVCIATQNKWILILLIGTQFLQNMAEDWKHWLLVSSQGAQKDAHNF